MHCPNATLHILFHLQRRKFGDLLARRQSPALLIVASLERGAWPLGQIAIPDRFVNEFVRDIGLLTRRVVPHRFASGSASQLTL